MSAQATATAPGRQANRSWGAHLARLVDRWAVPVFAALAIGYLVLPIAVMILFSFNDPPGKFNFVWGELSLDAWLNPLGRLGLASALGTSIIVAFAATLIATILGTMIALGMERYRFRLRGPTETFILIPLATPEIVMGASLLTLFVGTAQEPLKSITGGFFFPLGTQTILIAHILFCISFVVVTVRARVAGFPRHLEEAAMDLGANEWVTFWKVTFPLIFPGIMAAALLAFSLSIDDFIVTNFTAGTSNTFPIWVWASIRNNLPPQVHVIGTIIFTTAVALVAVSTFRSLWIERRAARYRAEP
jgi:spermidine/putrescine transport system permease protein